MILMNAGNQIVVLFVGTFLVAQVFWASGESFTAIGLFAIIDWTSLFIFFFLASVLCKLIRPTWVIRMSAGLACGLLFLLVFQPDIIADWHLALAALWGAIQGLYWGANNFLVSETFGKETKLSYMVWFQLMVCFVKIVFPFTFGLIIDFESFFVTTVIILVVCLLTFGFSFFVRAEKREPQRLKMFKMLKVFKEQSFTRPAWSFAFVTFLNGLTGAMTISMTIMVLMTFGTNLSLGILMTVGSAVTIAMLWAYRRWKNKVGTPLFFASAILPLLAGLPLFFTISYATVVISQGAIVAFRRIISVEEETVRLTMAKYMGREDFNVEVNLFYEIMLWLGRITSGGLVVMLGVFSAPPIAFAAVFVIMLLFLLVHAMLVLAWKKKYLHT